MTLGQGPRHGSLPLKGVGAYRTFVSGTVLLIHSFLIRSPPQEGALGTWLGAPILQVPFWDLRALPSLSLQLLREPRNDPGSGTCVVRVGFYVTLCPGPWKGGGSAG